MARGPKIPFSKRALDVALSLVLLLLTAPVMIVAAVLIKLSSSGPVFYVAPRAGWGGGTFGQYKFRTMHPGADRGGAFTANDDQRVFPVGRLLRLFKLDELPQMLNILRGEMSVVGPRPEAVETVRDYYTPQQRQVLEAPPGLTGIPQVRFFPELSVIDPEAHLLAGSAPHRANRLLAPVRVLEGADLRTQAPVPAGAGDSLYWRWRRWLGNARRAPPARENSRRRGRAGCS